MSFLERSHNIFSSYPSINTHSFPSMRVFFLLGVHLTMTNLLLSNLYSLRSPTSSRICCSGYFEESSTGVIGSPKTWVSSLGVTIYFRAQSLVFGVLIMLRPNPREWLSPRYESFDSDAFELFRGVSCCSDEPSILVLTPATSNFFFSLGSFRKHCFHHSIHSSSGS